MKVVHVLGELNHSGAERMLECSYTQWRAAGVEPAVVGMSDGSHPFAPALARAGYEVSVLPPVRSLRGLSALRHSLRRSRPDVVHVHSESCFDLVSLLARTTPGTRGVVRTVHSSFRYGGTLKARRVVRTWLARSLGTVWVACSAEVATGERAYSRRPPVGVVENWVDVARIRRETTPDAGARTREALSIPAGSRVLTVVGNCAPAKNHELVAQALVECDSRFHVLHVGDASGRSAREFETWNELRRRHTVHDLGVREDVPALLAASDLFLIPSHYEGFSLAAVEALCAGVPVLAADTVGLRWLAEADAVALVPFEPTEWARAIEGAFDGSVGQRSGRRAVGARARTRFTADRGVAEYVAIYRECGGTGRQ